MLQGLTADYLTVSTYAVKANDVVAVHAAAAESVVSSCSSQNTSALSVVATTSTPEKAAIARVWPEPTSSFPTTTSPARSPG